MPGLVTVHTIFRGSDGVSSEAGFTLFEALMAAVVLIVGLIGLLGLLDTSVKASAATRAREGATNLAREILEDARTIPYAQLSPTSIESQLQAMNGLANTGSGSTWQISRRGFAYTVAVKECAIDDPKDGLAKTHESGVFCEGQQEWTTGDAEDSTPEDLKRITAEVSWAVQGRTSTVKQVSTLTAAGQATGLNVSNLELTSPFSSTAPVITEEATKTLTFSVSFPESTSAITWSLEGTKQQELTPESKATSLTFSWTIDEPAQKIYVSDGTYQISVQATNSTGVLGPPVTISVRLIRGVPGEPEGVEGGFNKLYNTSGVQTEVAELQWHANSERNVIGYRVHKTKADGKEEEVCPGGSTLSLTTSCIDFEPPSKTAPEVQRTYSITALYLDSTGTLQEGKKASFTLSSAPETPNAPTGLILTKEADGAVKLEWSAPVGGPTIDFYRIYRGSKDYTGRYSTSFATNYTDTDAAETHEYWVTAISSTLTESEFLGPVSG
jgi:Tfp pilus assembly protein PilV